KFFFWADVDARTRETAEALEKGLGEGGIKDVKVASLPLGRTVDLLFHPFKAQCGRPVQSELDPILSDIKSNGIRWFAERTPTAMQLLNVLNCPSRENSMRKCTQLVEVPDTVTGCTRPSKSCPSPIVWKGRFSYASSATEAFLLEYANGM